MFILMNLVFHISKDGSEIELKHCASSRTSVKSSQKYFVHLNWIRLAINPSWLDTSPLVERRSRNPRMRVHILPRKRILRCSLQCQNNMNLVFHISEDGSEIQYKNNFMSIFRKDVRY